MIVKLRKIGNSTGVLLSKSILAQCALEDEASISIKDNAIVIEPVKRKARAGWKEQFIKAGSLDDHENLLGNFSNKFDGEEWTW